MRYLLLICLALSACTTELVKARQDAEEWDQADARCYYRGAVARYDQDVYLKCMRAAGWIPAQ